MKKATIIIPTYNEDGTIEKVITALFTEAKQITKWEIHILVVDSTSPDNTSTIVKNLQKKYKNLHLLETPKEGLGKAYIAGFNYAIDKLNSYLLFEMDADLQHEPKMIPEFLAQIEQGADFVIGSRYIKGGSIPKTWGFHRKVQSVFGNLILRYGFMKLQVTDWTSGFRAIKAWTVKNCLPYLNPYTGYVFQVALLDNAIKNGAVVRSVPITFQDRSLGVSKINSVQYSMQTILYVLTHSSFIKFVMVGALGFFIDFSIFYSLTKHAHFATVFANLISTETAVISNFLLNNFWSFSHKKVEHKLSSYIKAFLKFNLVSSGSILIQTLGVEILQLTLGSKYIYEYKIFIILCIVIPYSYIFYNKVIWKTKK